MSDVRDVNDLHAVVANDLQRRRELAGMTKPELISYIIRIENSLDAMSDQFEIGHAGPLHFFGRFTGENDHEVYLPLDPDKRERSIAAWADIPRGTE